MNFQVMFFYVYILESEKSKVFYVGYTNNLQKRIEEHNNGENISTKNDIPWRIIYCEACLNEKDARRREKYLKTSQGARLIKLRVKEYLYSRRS